MKVNGVEFSGWALTVYRKMVEPKTWTVCHEGGETELDLHKEFNEPTVSDLLLRVFKFSQRKFLESLKNLYRCFV